MELHREGSALQPAQQAGFLVKAQMSVNNSSFVREENQNEFRMATQDMPGFLLKVPV